MKTLTALVVIVLSIVLAGCIDTGDGERVGQVIKLNKQGVFCKTWEGDIIKGGISSGSGAMGGMFEFTVADPTLIETIKAAQDSGAEVKLHYNMELLTLCRSDSNNHFVDKVTVMSTGTNPNREATAVEAPTPHKSDRAQTITELLKTQAQLIEQLSNQ